MKKKSCLISSRLTAVKQCTKKWLFSSCIWMRKNFQLYAVIQIKSFINKITYNKKICFSIKILLYSFRNYDSDTGTTKLDILAILTQLGLGLSDYLFLNKIQHPGLGSQCIQIRGKIFGTLLSSSILRKVNFKFLEYILEKFLEYKKNS